ncbi:MAG: TIGR01459 family HAD-type hydrolase [Pelagibacteraceae bacterium]
MKKLEHLSEIFKEYDSFIIDLWGVMHDGFTLNPEALEVVENLLIHNKRITFLSNAPRPNASVIKFLKKLKMKEEYLQYVLTSGEAAVNSLKEKKFGENFFHLGPERDKPLFSGLEKNVTTLEKSNFILCTGLFDNKKDDLKFYKELLKGNEKKKLICTNPDLTVYKGDIKEYCAGSVAEVFKSMGGQVVYFGKPHSEIYSLCLKKEEKNFIIGDNLNTDIKGANNINADSLFILDGVHRAEYTDENKLDELMHKYKVHSKYFQKKLCW